MSLATAREPSENQILNFWDCSAEGPLLESKLPVRKGLPFQNGAILSMQLLQTTKRTLSTVSTAFPSHPRLEAKDWTEWDAPRCRCSTAPKVQEKRTSKPALHKEEYAYTHPVSKHTGVTANAAVFSSATLLLPTAKVGTQEFSP